VCPGLYLSSILIWFGRGYHRTKKHKLRKNADNRARTVLQKQKKRTGVAILGKHDDSLSEDIKCQGEVKGECIRIGEKLASACL